MKIAKYKEEWANLIRQNMVYLITILVLLSLNIFLVFQLTEKVNNRLVILVPQTLSKEAKYEGNKPDPAYLEAMGVYVVSLVSSYTPKTVKAKLYRFLDLVPPEYYHQVKDKIDKTIKREKKFGITQTFVPKELPKIYSSKIEIVGFLKRKFSEKIEDTYLVKYIIYYRINPQGKFEVIKYDTEKIS